MGSVYLRSQDKRWVAAVSRGPRGARRAIVRYASSEADARRLLEELEGPPEWLRVDRTGDCWPWTGARSRGGYGMVRDGGRLRIASRYIFEREVGPIPEGMNVLHRCDNPPCVRPDHLFLGTQADNVRDMVEKGRHRSPGRASHSPATVPTSSSGTVAPSSAAR